MPKPPPPSNWDPILLISQIISLQSLHYLVLSILIPPLLGIFAEPNSLAYEGGAANVGMVMDWREMAGRPTVRGMLGAGGRAGAWSGGRKIGYGYEVELALWDGRIDPMRGWVIAFCWVVACGADIYAISALIRRPRMVLDFTLTILLNHIILTTYYSAAFPTSLFWWAVTSVGAAMTVILAEQICVRREMEEGLKVVGVREEDIEMGGIDEGRRD